MAEAERSFPYTREQLEQYVDRLNTETDRKYEAGGVDTKKEGAELYAIRRLRDSLSANQRELLDAVVLDAYVDALNAVLGRRVPIVYLPSEHNIDFRMIGRR